MIRKSFRIKKPNTLDYWDILHIVTHIMKTDHEIILLNIESLNNGYLIEADECTCLMLYV